MKRVFQILMFVQGVVWLIFCAYSYIGSLQTSVIVAILLGLNGILYLSFALVFDRARWLKVVTFLFLAGNTVLTVTDQMGAYDYCILAFNLVSVAALVASLTKRR